MMRIKEKKAHQSRKNRRLCGVLLFLLFHFNACTPWDPIWERDRDPQRFTVPSSQGEPQVAPLDTTPSSLGEVDTNGWSREKLFAYFNELRGDGYSLDALPRRLESADSKVPCLADDQQIYRGTEVKWIPMTVHPAFVERLKKLELIFAEEAESYYGRPPKTVYHEGGYACRASRFQSTRISEHAFGNAIDITGFSFGPLSTEGSKSLPKSVPRGT